MFILYIIMYKIITCTASNCFFYPLSLTIYLRMHCLQTPIACREQGVLTPSLAWVSAFIVNGTPWHTCTSRIKHTHFTDLPTPNVEWGLSQCHFWNGKFCSINDIITKAWWKLGQFSHSKSSFWMEWWLTLNARQLAGLKLPVKAQTQ